MEKRKAKHLCKKSISFLLALLLVLTAIPLGGLSAFAATSGDFEYNVLSEEDKTCEITGYTGEKTNLVIPSKLDGYTVTRIGESAFYRCEVLTSVTIPDSVCYIGDYAFSECFALTSISLPESNCYIGIAAFFETAITQLDIPADTFFDFLYDSDSQTVEIHVPFGSLAWYCALRSGIEPICTTSVGNITSVTPGPNAMEITLDAYTLPSEIAANFEEFYGATIVQFTADKPCLLYELLLESNLYATYLFDPNSGSVQQVYQILTDLTVGNTYYLALCSMTNEPTKGQFAIYSIFDLIDETVKIEEYLPLVVKASNEQSVYGLAFTPTEDAVYYLDAVPQLDYFASDHSGRLIEAQEYGYALTAGETYYFIVSPYAEQTTECTLRRLQTENGFTYIVQNHQANVVSYTGTSQTVIVPEQLGGYPVMRLYSDSFKHNPYMQSIVIPSNILYIGSVYEEENIFADCPNLKTVYGYTGSTAEEFANQYGYTFIPLTVNESENGIAVEFSPENLPTVPTALQVTQISTTDEQQTYDITLTANGNPVQPAAPVTVKIPVPATMDSAKCKVYRQEADDTYTDMQAVYKDGYMVFTTDHFSIYVLTTKDPNAPAVMIGDVNNDGKVNAVDARWILQTASGERTLPEEQSAAADVNGDGKINAVDARWILQVASGERVL